MQRGTERMNRASAVQVFSRTYVERPFRTGTRANKQELIYANQNPPYLGIHREAILLPWIRLRHPSFCHSCTCGRCGNASCWWMYFAAASAAKLDNTTVNLTELVWIFQCTWAHCAYPGADRRSRKHLLATIDVNDTVSIINIRWNRADIEQKADFRC